MKTSSRKITHKNIILAAIRKLEKEQDFTCILLEEVFKRGLHYNRLSLGVSEHYSDLFDFNGRALEGIVGYDYSNEDRYNLRKMLLAMYLACHKDFINEE